MHGKAVDEMKGYQYILFDLDGTLTDPFEGITNSVRYALSKVGIEAQNSDLTCFIGPPLKESFMKYYGFSDCDAEKMIETYREYFSVDGLFENRVYDGIEALLNRLCESGKTLIVATSKPEVFSKRILDHFGLSKYFRLIAGSNLDGTRVKKGEVIRYALQTAGITQKDAVVMIGDRHHDIDGANENGVDSVGVLYGYGNREEFEAAGATFIAATVEELEELL